MMSSMTCGAFADTLADFLERDVAEPTRAAMESHALECEECGTLLADLRKLRIDAASLPELAPSRDLWMGIAARIDAPVIPIGAARDLSAGPAPARMSRRREIGRWMPMAAAAALLIAVTSATTYYFTVKGADRDALGVIPNPTSAPLPPDPTAASASIAASRAGSGVVAPATRFVSAKPSAEQVYGTEIGRLKAIVERRRAQLDPVTVSVIERNLKVIDDAIAQCKEALGKDPASRFLLESLNQALETKVELLRTAAMLPSRT